MARVAWVQQPLRGFPWPLKYLICHQMITQTHPKLDLQLTACWRNRGKSTLCSLARRW